MAFAELLAGPGVERGLIGPGETARLWERHLLNSAVVAELVPSEIMPPPEMPPARATSRPSELAPSPMSAWAQAPATRLSANESPEVAPPPGMTQPASRAGTPRLADLGSGAGLPGIVLAIMLPAAHVVLVEPMERRTAFLVECAKALGLGNVKVLRGRAEDLAGDVEADVVTSRAVARLDRLAVLAAGLARPGGLVLAIKGASAKDELDQAQPELRRLGASEAEIVRAGVGIVDPPATVVRFRVGPRSETVRRSGTRSRSRKSRR